MLVAVLLGLAGCGRDEGKKAATQVAAKVNSDEISVHQINDILGKTPNVSPENAADVKREILDKLIDRQLAMQAAVERKLDRTPAVVSAIEAARSEILGRAYLEQVVSALPKPTDQEATAFYAAHPELFAQRRLLNLQEIRIPARPDLLSALKEQVAQGHSMTDIAAWLKSRDVKFAASEGARAAEQIPIEILPRVHAMKDGQTLVLEDGIAIVVDHLVASQSQPVDEATALPRIRQFLVNQQSNQAAQKELVALREKASVQYLGEFAADKPVAPPVAGNAAGTEKAKATPAAGYLEKGLAGLR